MSSLAPNPATSFPHPAEMLNVSFEPSCHGSSDDVPFGAGEILVIAPLVAIFGYLVYRGIGSLDLNLLTKMPKPVGEVGGGMANAIAGSALILGSPACWVSPPGSGRVFIGGVRTGGRFGSVVRFTRMCSMAYRRLSLHCGLCHRRNSAKAFFRACRRCGAPPS